MIAWKRVYIEMDEMYTEGATIIEDANAGATVLTVDSVQDFNVGDEVVVFWKGGSHDATITDIHPEVTIQGGGGTGAEARAEVKQGAITKVILSNAGAGYLWVPSILISENPGTMASAKATLVSTGIQIEVVNGGREYAVAPTLSISAPDEPGGTQATATASITANGEVTVTVTNAGAGYRIPPTVTVVGGDGQNFLVLGRLLPTQIEKIEINPGGGGFGYKCVIGFSDHPLPQNVVKYSGVRPKTPPSTYKVDIRYLKNAFGKNPDGSDGGAFIEFKDAPSGSEAVPRYNFFPDYIAWYEYSNFWFDNKSDRTNNTLHLLAASDSDEVGGWGYSLYEVTVGSLCVVFTAVYMQDVETEDVQKDDAVVHEIGHRFNLIKAHYPYVDTISNIRNHEDTDYCVMSYKTIRTDQNIEFGVDALLHGSTSSSSLRDLEDK
jgi:hypothetical protein